MSLETVTLREIIKERMKGKVSSERQRLYVLRDLTSSAKYLDVKRAADH